MFDLGQVGVDLGGVVPGPDPPEPASNPVGTVDGDDSRAAAAGSRTTSTASTPTATTAVTVTTTQVSIGPPGRMAEGSMARRRAREDHEVTLLAFPALNEARHVPRLAEFAAALVAAGVVDRAVLLDGGSRDDSVTLAAAHGLEVVDAPTVAGRPTRGKGDAVGVLLHTTDADRVVLLDADVEGLTAASVRRLLDALREPVVLVKGVCRRLDPATGTVRSGRVSELVARPALELLGSAFAGLRDPLSGQVALRTAAVRGLDLHPGYGLELSMLLGLEARVGAEAVAEVDLEPIAHRHKDVDELATVAREVMAVALGAAAHGQAPWPSTTTPESP